MASGVKQILDVIVCSDASHQESTKMCGWSYIISSKGKIQLYSGIHENVKNIQEAEFIALAYALLKVKELGFNSIKYYGDNEMILTWLRMIFTSQEKKKKKEIPEWILEILQEFKNEDFKISINKVKGHPEKYLHYQEHLMKLVDLHSKSYKE